MLSTFLYCTASSMLRSRGGAFPHASSTCKCHLPVPVLLGYGSRPSDGCGLRSGATHPKLPARRQQLNMDVPTVRGYLNEPLLGARSEQQRASYARAYILPLNAHYQPAAPAASPRGPHYPLSSVPSMTLAVTVAMTLSRCNRWPWHSRRRGSKKGGQKRGKPDGPLSRNS